MGSENEEPELHRMVSELAEEAGIPSPGWHIQIAVPTRLLRESLRDGRVCITSGIRGFEQG